MTKETVTVTQGDRIASDNAFDIAFRGDTDGIDQAMASLFARHRIEATRELEAQLAEALWLLNDCQTILDDAAHPSCVTPNQEINNEVRELGHRIGFGALMSCASAQWRLWLEADGIAGGEFACSPCRATAQNAADRIAAFLSRMGGQSDGK